MTQKTPGALTARLISAGWTRLTESAGECGSAPGFCVRSARWYRLGARRPMCAQHAAQLDNIHEETPVKLTPAMRLALEILDKRGYVSRSALLTAGAQPQTVGRTLEALIKRGDLADSGDPYALHRRPAV